MKKCFKCGHEKPLGDFYKHKAMADGYLGKCKECTKADVTQYRLANIETVRAYDRSRGNLPHRVEARQQYRQTEQGKEAVKSGSMAYLSRNPGKRTAHTKVGNAVRDGRISREPCEWCGTSPSQAHHFDYTKPLEITWLCVKCHNTVHKIHREHNRRQVLTQ